MASPFRYFRKHQKVFLAIAVLVAMFVFVVGDMITGMIGGSASGPQSPKTVVAEWDGGSVNVQELEILTQRRYFVSEALKRLQITGARRIMEEGGNPTSPPIPNFIFQENPPAQQVRIGVVTNRMLAEQAKSTGISVSNEMINHYLKECSFRRVNESELISILQSVRQGSPGALLDQLFAGLRELLLEDTYFRNCVGNVRNLLPEQRWEDWQRINNRISLEVAQLPAKQFVSEVPDPSEGELLAFYNQHKDQVKDALMFVGGKQLPSPEPGFKEPRRVKLNYIVADVNARKEKLRDSVTEEEIADYYERNKRSQFVKTGGSISPFQEGLFSDDEEADGEETTATTDEAAEEGAEGASVEESSEVSPGEDEGAFDQSDSAEVEEQASSEEPAADEPAEETPVEDEPVAEPSAGEAPAEGEVAEEPATEEPATEEPADEEPADDAAEQPDEDDSSYRAIDSPFRLAAFQADLSAEGESEGSTDESARGEGDAEDSVGEVASEEEFTQDASAESADTDGGEAEDTAGEDDAEVEYMPLLDVKDSIRDKLATDKAVVELKQEVDSIYGALSNAYKKYGTAVVEARSEEQTVPDPPENLTNLKQRAADASLISEETVLLTYQELADTVVGRSLDYQSQNRSTAVAAFTSLQTYEPFLAQDLDANWYIVTKVEDVPERVPELDEIRDEVLSAWKLQEASKLAQSKAEELAKEAEEAGGALANFIDEKPYEVVTTDLFSWLTFGNTTYEMQRGPRLGEVPPLESIGPEFMETAFELDDSEVTSETNFDHTMAYVMKINRRERTKEELRELFLSEANDWYGAQIMAAIRLQNQRRAVLEELMTRLGLDLSPLEEMYSENAGAEEE